MGKTKLERMIERYREIAGPTPLHDQKVSIEALVEISDRLDALERALAALQGAD